MLKFLLTKLHKFITIKCLVDLNNKLLFLLFYKKLFFPLKLIPVFFFNKKNNFL